MTGGSSVTEVKQLQTKLMTMLKKGGFELRKWASNHKKLFNHLPEADIENKGNVSSEYSTTDEALIWNSTTENFHYSINRNKKPHIITKIEV